MRDRPAAVQIVAMATWGWIAAGYGVLLAVASVALDRVRRRLFATAASTTYAVVALTTATSDAFAIQLVAPGALLYCGYRLSGLLRRAPDLWLERLLLASDRWLFERLRLDRALAASPGWILELFEASYAADYLAVAAGALVSAASSGRALSHYWTLVLGAELPCYVALVWLQTRPPRVLQSGMVERRAPVLRRLNAAILERGSVEANTIPSGHVAGVVAISFAVLPVNATAGWIFVVAAMMVSVSAFVCRYHYALDCLTGAVVGCAVSLILS